MKRKTSMADCLRNEILKSDLTVNAIAVQAGVPQPVLHRFVKGERDLTLRSAEKLIRFFNLELRKKRQK